MNIETLRIAELTPDPNNARQHDDKNLKAIMGSLKEFGQRKPIVITEAGTIVAGNGTVEAAKRLGWLDIQVVRVPADWTDAQVKAFAIADNRTAELANWNQEVLTSQLLELEAEGWELAEFGFEPLEMPVTSDDNLDDEVPESAPGRVAVGDIWQLGNHRLMCGDATNEQHISKLLDNNQIDMIFTDPPYGINEKGDRSNRGGLGKGGLAKAKKYHDFVDDSVEYAEKAFDIASGLDIPIQVWFGANYYAHHLPQTSNWLVWDKRVEEKQRDTQSDCELAWVKSRYNSIRIFRHLWKGMMKDSEHGVARVHPTQKPIELVKWCFNEYGESTKVLDFFAGSGTTLIACEQTNRKCFALDLDPKYCDVIIERWEKLTGQKAELLPAKAD
jgi:16S rRNA G966 N2-methylase RsmD